jgi:flagellar biosynthesis/type III secretory pathway protein FliH
LEFLRATGELNAIGEITEEKQMYDAREKASLDIQSNLIDARREGHQEGHQEGRQEGRQEGESVGRVKAYQELLGDSIASDEELTQMTSEQLTCTILDLQTRLRERNA